MNEDSSAATVRQCVEPQCQASGSCGIFVNDMCPECGGVKYWMIDEALIQGISLGGDLFERKGGPA